MPNIYVFPGGRVDALDGQPSGFTEYLPPPPDRSSLSEREFAVYARAALRETFEETGLLIAETGTPLNAPSPATVPRTGSIWAAYAQAGLTPAFETLRLIAHAITPATYPIRFDTYFFAADGAMAHGTLAGDGELEDVGWVPVGSAAALPMAKITRLILREALIRQDNPNKTGVLETFSI